MKQNISGTAGTIIIIVVVVVVLFFGLKFAMKAGGGPDADVSKANQDHWAQVQKKAAEVDAARQRGEVKPNAGASDYMAAHQMGGGRNSSGH